MSELVIKQCDYCPKNLSLARRLAVTPLTIQANGTTIKRDACKRHTTMVLGQAVEKPERQEKPASQRTVTGELCPKCTGEPRPAGHMGRHTGPMAKKVAASKKRRVKRGKAKPILRKGSRKAA